MRCNLLFFTIFLTILFNHYFALANVADFESVVSNIEKPMKGLIIKALSAVWGLLAIILLGATCWQGFQKRIPIEDVVVKSIWIALIGFIPMIATFLVNLGSSIGN